MAPHGNLGHLGECWILGKHVEGRKGFSGRKDVSNSHLTLNMSPLACVCVCFYFWTVAEGTVDVEALTPSKELNVLMLGSKNSIKH